MFEVGGEVSSGGTYTWAFTESRTDSVECAVASGNRKTLSLYNVESDMECQFNTVTMVPDTRNGKRIDYGPFDSFTVAERKVTETDPIIISGNKKVLPNLDLDLVRSIIGKDETHISRLESIHRHYFTLAQP